MSALSGFLGGAIVGAGTAYTKLADEQREFRIDQVKQDALYARMLNLKRAEKDMEYSGVLDEAGMPMTRKQLDEYDGDRSALMGSVDQAAKLQEIKEAGQPSQYMTQDRVVLTKGELADYLKNNGSLDGLTPVNLQARQDTVDDRRASEAAAYRRQQHSDSRYLARQDAQAAAAEAKLTAAREKEERAMVDTFTKGLQDEVKDSGADIEEKWVNGDLEQHPGMSEGDSLNAWKTANRVDTVVNYLQQVPHVYKEKLFEKDPSLREYTNVPRVAKSNKLSGKSMEEVEDELVSQGYTKEQVKLVTDYAITKGYAKYSPPKPIRWNPRRETWVQPTGYRMKKR